MKCSATYLSVLFGPLACELELEDHERTEDGRPRHRASVEPLADFPDGSSSYYWIDVDADELAALVELSRVLDGSEAPPC